MSGLNAPSARVSGAGIQGRIHATPLENFLSSRFKESRLRLSYRSIQYGEYGIPGDRSHDRLEMDHPPVRDAYFRKLGFLLRNLSRPGCFSECQ